MSRLKIDVIAESLKKNTTLTELYKLNEQYPGVLYKFWRHTSTNPFFTQWLDMMEKREAVSQKGDKKVTEEKVVIPIVVKPEIKQETEMERVNRELKEIMEKY